MISHYLRENPGADFIAAFIVALIAATIVNFYDRDLANEYAMLAFFSLVASVILQTLTMRSRKKQRS